MQKSLIEKLVNSEPALARMFAELFMVRAPNGSAIQFNLKPGQCTYRYYHTNGQMHCYTPHADTHGRFWCWTYKRHGNTWRMVNIQERRNLNAARRDARQRAKLD